MIFRDRSEAGRKLARRLAQRGYVRPVVLALPRGGVPVAVAVARALDAPLDLLLVRKIGHPHQPELALGAIVDGDQPELLINPQFNEIAAANAGYLSVARAEALAEIERRRALYLGGRTPAEVAGATAIIVDDGIATGATVRAALKALRRRRAARIVLAVPVAPADVLAELRAEVDEVVCLHAPERFVSVGQFYGDFRQVDDAEVMRLLGAGSAAAS
ncbi:MAG: phosphoribosyltransferase [Alphaproteobacteria bacterium]|jgi:putative phosphoribosyl transferase